MIRITIGEFDGYGYEISFSEQDELHRWKLQPNYCVAIGAKNMKEAKMILDRIRNNETL